MGLTKIHFHGQIPAPGKFRNICTFSQMMKAGQTAPSQSNSLISATLCAKATAPKKVTAKVTGHPLRAMLSETQIICKNFNMKEMLGFSIGGADILGAFSEALSHPEAFSPP